MENRISTGQERPFDNKIKKAGKRLRIKEIIVVEGRDDETAVKRAVEAEIIITSGFGIKEETFQRIEFAQKKKGVIVLTDPDHPGEQIRKRINTRIKGCKNAYLTKKEALKKNDIGIENASPESIREALKKAKCVREEALQEFTRSDLLKHTLIGGSLSADRRDRLGKILGIGYANAKQLISRLNNYGISREQFENALKEMET